MVGVLGELLKIMCQKKLICAGSCTEMLGSLSFHTLTAG